MAGFAHFLGLNYGIHRAQQEQQNANGQAQSQNATGQPYKGGIEESLVNSEKTANEQAAANSGGIEESLVDSGDKGIGQYSPPPKYRLPNDEEARRAIRAMKLGKHAIVTATAPVSLGTSALIEGAYILAEDTLEERAKNEKYIPIYENWDADDWKEMPD